MVKEQIEDIANRIKIHRENEINSQSSNNAIGRLLVDYDKQEKVIWLTLRPKVEMSYRSDILGNIDPNSAIKTHHTYDGDGTNIQRDSKLGALFIQHYEGIHKHTTPRGEIEIEIFNRAVYTPCMTSFSEDECAIDISINLSGDSKTHYFENLSEILALQLEIEQEKKKLLKATEEQTHELITRINRKEEEKKRLLSKTQSFIRKSASLRFQPILDPIQESIKRSRLFDGCLVINGGPGTGKTTSLIQRIKYLISDTIEEVKEDLTSKQKAILYDEKSSWIFYSPNELLALFLRNSMRMEGLTADPKRVKVWFAHRNELVKSYKLVDTQTMRPFMMYRNTADKCLITNRPENIVSITKNLEKYYFNYQKEKIANLLDIDVTAMTWRNTGMSIQKFLSGKKDLSTWDALIRLFINLSETYKSESDAISEGYNKSIETVAARVQLLVSQDDDRLSKIKRLLTSWKTSGQENEEEADEIEIEQEDFDEKEDTLILDQEKELFIKLKSLCRKQALSRFDKNTKISGKEKELLELIPEAVDQPEYKNIGNTAFFKKYFESVTRGTVPNVLREIPLIYKRFRKEQLISKSVDYDLFVLERLVKTDKNTRIHSDEQDLLLYFINTICRILAKNFNNQYNRISHPYLTAYKANCKPVIAVDEATDFSLIDLLAISSFEHPDISSVTFCGDVMQAMTECGLRSWDDLSAVIPNTHISNLKVSYRQSATLLSLAGSIYKQVTGNKASYHSFIKKHREEPKPLVMVSEDEEEKMNWIADRIIEIYKAYDDKIPSIAIFLPQEERIQHFASLLGNIDTLADVGINVKACRDGEVLGDENFVRVFSIDKIKGLEFEAVFFYDLDRLQELHFPEELLLKYLYVGLSRATFYLGLTLSKEFSDNLSFLKENFDTTSRKWLIDI